LIEAGPTDNILEVKLPPAFPKLFNSKVDWGYITEKQDYLNDRKLIWPRGKMIGGSSNMNAMIWHFGHSSDYNKMGKVNNGWSYEDVLPYFKKLENNNGKNIELKYHGFNGKIHVNDQIHPHEISKKMIESFKKTGTKETRDINGEQQEGCLLFQVNQKKRAKELCCRWLLVIRCIKKKKFKNNT